MPNKTVKIKYVKAYDYKTSLATGIITALTTHGLINMSFFTDRAIFPKSQTIEFDETGKQIGKPLDEKDGDLTREVQFGAIMDINTAKQMLNVLQAKIQEHELKYKS